METIFRNKIEDKQGNIKYDPDSSPEAWEHYKKVYGKQLKLDEEYDISQSKFFKYVEPNLYIDEKSEAEYNRLYALSKNIVAHKNDYEKCDYYQACNRLSGDVDFNFNEEHSSVIGSLLCQEQDKKKREEYLIKLEECKNMHHTLLNFSLMQTVGNMQKFKGSECNDRLDKFLFFLHEYYTNGDTAIFQNASSSNQKGLKNYLDSFSSFEDYCDKIYFLKNNKLITKLLESGKQSLNTPQLAIEYIDLANEFWENKELAFISKYYPGYIEIYHSLFPDGGETYTFEQLKVEFESIVNDAEEFRDLLNIFIEKNWLYCCENETYTK